MNFDEEAGPKQDTVLAERVGYSALGLPIFKTKNLLHAVRER